MQSSRKVKILNRVKQNQRTNKEAIYKVNWLLLCGLTWYRYPDAGRPGRAGDEPEPRREHADETEKR